MTQTFRKMPLRHLCNRSAVSIMTAVIGGRRHLLMIRRASRQGDPWSGQMAFPGGRQDARDENILQTARREAFEEVGIDPGHSATYIARQSDLVTRSHHSWKPQVVTPFLFELPTPPNLQINHEASVGLWIPVSAFVGPEYPYPWKVGPFDFTLPCYYYQGHPVWGLSLLMIKGLKKVHPELFGAAEIR